MKFTLKTTLPASARDIYLTWLSSEGHSGMTGGTADISDEEGTGFSAWDGYIEGKNLALEPYQRIVQSWRTSQFAEEEPDSQIEILLKERIEGTELILIHTQVPKTGEHYIQGWEDNYFEPMRAYFTARET